MINCIYYETNEGWCKNRMLDMYQDYPSDHYCSGCYHRIEVNDADEDRTEQDPQTETDD